MDKNYSDIWIHLKKCIDSRKVLEFYVSDISNDNKQEIEFCNNLYNKYSFSNYTVECNIFYSGQDPNPKEIRVSLYLGNNILKVEYRNFLKYKGMQERKDEGNKDYFYLCTDDLTYLDRKDELCKFFIDNINKVISIIKEIHNISNTVLKPAKAFVLKKREEYPRNGKLVSEVLKKAKYECQINKDHKTFKDRHTNQRYMEAHHIIPLRWSKKLDIDLDIIENMICLCPRCHRAVHHSSEATMRKCLEKILSRKDSDLFVIDKDINIEKLLNYMVNEKL